MSYEKYYLYKYEPNSCVKCINFISKVLEDSSNVAFLIQNGMNTKTIIDENFLSDYKDQITFLKSNQVNGVFKKAFKQNDLLIIKNDSIHKSISFGQKTIELGK
jgi:hypothetical protein